MPRNGRGGARQGRDGVAYSNRSDLNEGPRLDRTDLRQAAETQQPTTGAPAPPLAAPGPPPNLLGPTENNRPVTHGLPTGPGAGPEALGFGGPDLSRLAAYLPVLEVLASRPDTDQSMRNFVRLVRANAPIGR